LISGTLAIVLGHLQYFYLPVLLVSCPLYTHLASTQGKPNNSKLEIKEQDNFEYSKKSMNNDQCCGINKPLDQDWDALYSKSTGWDLGKYHKLRLYQH
jgi:hypothetical protein